MEYKMDEEKSLISWQKRVYQLVFFCLVGVIFFFLLKLGKTFEEILVSFSLAIVLNYLLAKPVELLTRFIHFRFLSVMIILLSFISGIALGGFYLFPIIGTQLQALQNALPKLLINIYEALENLNLFLANYQLHIPIEEINKAQVLNSALESFKLVELSDFGQFAGSIFLSSVTVIIYMIITTVLTIYLLVDGNRVWQMFLSPFSKRLKTHFQEIKKRVDGNMYAFVFGQFQIASLTTFVMLTTYVILGIPYGILLGLIQMLEVLPILGTWMAIVPCIIIIIFSSGLSKGLIALVVYLIYTQFVRDNIVAPRIMGSAIGFHPVAIIFGLFIGAKIGGAIGIVLALPALTIIGSTIGHFSEMNRLKVQFTD